ncbi:uncharacterized protein CANTADRAFT_5600 [Suhomyces tanzawaensis NRRL Y-17324]|uniref:Uncharacterized protein n=1 Tax=Suhomyces tanzawaensis NRRL Y-17324 TaxID=984487 RepID=A0A1E4SKE4_9ASCO|nr:uncharacterized protein CANTADRAFT_5600 [Suhomyces tanzawaensis NRRL Y-17324]ODV79907.1 hypothetical protein CANTADRAFT_5600 [Suhomyces tanzawaensis NRRL Y-17324]
MSLSRKVGNYQNQKSAIIAEYLDLRKEVDIVDEQESFELLLYLDEILYEYHVVKGYIESSKLQLNEFDSMIFDQIQSLAKKLLDSVPIPELSEKIKRLPIVRRELQENAREAGKIHTLMSAAGSNRFLEPSIIPEDFDLSTKKTKGAGSKSSKNLGIFLNGQWSKEHVRCVVEGASDPSFTRQPEKTNHVKNLFEQRFGINVSLKAVRYLMLHYGFRKTGYALKEFHSAFDEAFLRYEFSSPPASYHKVQAYLSRKIPNVLMNDIEYGFRMRRLFRKIYGNHFEPAENYEEFKHMVPYLVPARGKYKKSLRQGPNATFQETSPKDLPDDSRMETTI